MPENYHHTVEVGSHGSHRQLARHQMLDEDLVFEGQSLVYNRLSFHEHSLSIYKMTDQNELKQQFSQNIEELSGSLYRVALRLAGNNADAEDLVAIAVTKAWTSIDKLEDVDRFRPWIFKILNNCFIDEFRKKSVRPKETPYDEHYVDYGVDEVQTIIFNESDDFVYWWGNPEREFANQLLNDQIMAAIDSLPEAFRITVSLVNIEGLSYDDAAEVLGVPPGTVRSRMKRGRTLLQKALWNQAKESGLVSDSTSSGKGCQT